MAKCVGKMRVWMPWLLEWGRRQRVRRAASPTLGHRQPWPWSHQERGTHPLPSSCFSQSYPRWFLAVFLWTLKLAYIRNSLGVGLCKRQKKMKLKNGMEWTKKYFKNFYLTLSGTEIIPCQCDVAMEATSSTSSGSLRSRKSRKTSLVAKPLNSW